MDEIAKVDGGGLARRIGSNGGTLSPLQVAEAFAASGFFAPLRESIPPAVQAAAQAFVRISAGAELGIGPVASMTGIHVISGKPEIGSRVLAALVRRSERYDYRVPVHTSERCEVSILDKATGEELGSASFTMDDARQAGLANKDNWKRHPADMLYARAMSAAVRRHAPDVALGAYVTGEIGDGVDGLTGGVVSVPDTRGVRSALGEVIRHATEGEPLPLAPEEKPPVVEPVAAEPKPAAWLGGPFAALPDADIRAWCERWPPQSALPCPQCGGERGQPCRAKSGRATAKPHRRRFDAVGDDVNDAVIDLELERSENAALAADAVADVAAPDWATALGESNAHLIDDIKGDGDLSRATARALYGLTAGRVGAGEAMEMWQVAGVALRPGVVIPRQAARAVLVALVKMASREES